MDVTSATGGSASSQADSVERRAWAPRPVVSFSIHALVIVMPVVVGVVAVKAGIWFVDRPVGRWAFVAWVAGLMAVSVAASMGAHRSLRRFAPLAVLFKMSLVFPDEAPSRFQAALRSRTTRKLARSSAPGGRAPSVEQAAAENLIALMVELSRHDRLTRGHAERVRAYSVMLGEEIGLSADDLDKLNWAALVHDVGKLEVPEALLNKHGRPTEEEWAVLRTHPAAGAPYVEPLRGWLGDWILAATQHHERYDGGGYPLGLAGTDISLAGRIVAIADAFDVMTATRSYKTPLPAAQARAELTRNSGTQFDPHLVRSFLAISLGRMRTVVGPLGWMASTPDMIRVPLTVVASSMTSAVAAGTLSVAAAAGIIAAPAAPADAGSAIGFPVERPSSASAPIGDLDIAAGRGSGPGDVLATPVTTVPAINAAPTTVSSSTVPAINGGPTTGAPMTVSSSTVPAINAGPATVPATTVAPTTTVASTTVESTTVATTMTTVATTTVAPTTAPTTVPAINGGPTTVAPTTVATTTVATTTTAPSGSVRAEDDVATTRSNKTVSVHVLRNDDFGGSDPAVATLALVAGPTLGTTKVAGENIAYTSAPDVTGTDSFVYSICSLAGSCDQATVVVTITG